MAPRAAFFYGTLMAPEVLHRVIYGQDQVGHDPEKTLLAKSLTMTAAVLNDYSRHRVRFADYPGIIKDKGHSVKGIYVRGLTDDDVHRLTFFEGDEYTRMGVEVELEGGSRKAAETYVYTAGDHYLEDQEWDYEEFRKNKLRNWVGASREFYASDNAAAEAGKDGGEADGHHEIDGSSVVVNGAEADAANKGDDKDVHGTV